jgi:hypothetical protein
MNAIDARALTVGALLFGDQHDEEELRNRLHEQGALKGLAEALDRVPPGLRDVAVDRIGHVAQRVLDVDVLGVLGLGWQKYERLADAAQRTLRTPGSEEIVDLTTHRITSTHEPQVEVTVDGVAVATVGLRLELSAELHAVQAVVTAGTLIALRTGKADLTADLSCEGVPVAQGRRTIDLGVTLDLGAGLVLATSDT